MNLRSDCGFCHRTLMGLHTINASVNKSVALAQGCIALMLISIDMLLLFYARPYLEGIFFYADVPPSHLLNHAFKSALKPRPQAMPSSHAFSHALKPVHNQCFGRQLRRITKAALHSYSYRLACICYSMRARAWKALFSCGYRHHYLTCPWFTELPALLCLFVSDWKDFASCGFRLIAFTLVIIGFLFNCHQIADNQQKDEVCVDETILNRAFWFPITCAFALVLGGFVYDLRRKRHLEQRLPTIADKPEPAPPKLRFFW